MELSKAFTAISFSPKSNTPRDSNTMFHVQAARADNFLFFNRLISAFPFVKLW